MDPDSTPSMLPSMRIPPDATTPDFVTALDDKHKCVYCKGVLRPPVKQTMCGHRLCSSCVTSLLAEAEAPMCPGNEDCTILAPNEIHPDVAATKELQRMLVYCSFKDNGCQATPKWSALREHEENCEYATAQCHNPQCTATVLRSYLKRHEQHECEYLPVRCDACDEYVPRIELRGAHTKKCVPKRRKCPYSKLGCPFEGMPDELKKHKVECADEHSEQLIDKTTESSHETNILKRQIEDLSLKLKHLSTKINLPSSISNEHIKSIETTIENLNQKITYVTNSLEEKVDQRQLAQCFSKLEEIKATTRIHDSKFLQLEQNSEGGATNGEALLNYRRFESAVSACDQRLTEYDVRFRLLETAGYNGQMVWKITNYTQRKEDAREQRTLSLYSQPFYTSVYGYRMCARVYLNGDGMGKGTHLSLFFVVMKGDYDALLSWPFRQRVTLVLLDQSGSGRHLQDTFRPDPTSSSFKRPVKEMNVASGSPMFAAHDVVEGSRYMRDDTIFIGIVVDVSDLPQSLI